MYNLIYFDVNFSCWKCIWLLLIIENEGKLIALTNDKTATPQHPTNNIIDEKL